MPLKAKLKQVLSASAKKNLDAIRYELHLFVVRCANRFWPSCRNQRLALAKRSGTLLHWGCGSRRLDGWLNIDGWKSAATDYVHDLRTRLPLSDGSVALIFTEHVLEHLEFHWGEQVLRDFYRALEPGGTIRIIVPGLVECCNAFLNADKHWFEVVDAPCSTAGIGFNRIFYDHFHRYIYDFSTLELLLKRAGFSQVLHSSYRSSIEPRLNLDTSADSRRLVSLYVDAVK